MKKTVELSLRPYNGCLFYARSKKGYLRAHCELFASPDEAVRQDDGAIAGRVSMGEGKDGLWTYLVWAEDPPRLAHELSHVILHVFERCGIDPRDAGGEPFCYMLSQLMLDAHC